MGSHVGMEESMVDHYALSWPGASGQRAMDSSATEPHFSLMGASDQCFCHWLEVVTAFLPSLLRSVRRS
jgi:hypothetical protein